MNKEQPEPVPGPGAGNSRQLIPLTTEKFRARALAIPDAIDRFLATNPCGESVRNGIDYLGLEAAFARKIKAETEVVNAIQLGRLKLIARWGELNPAATAVARGKQGGETAGRGRKKATADATVAYDDDDFSENTRTLYRKVAANQALLADYDAEVQSNRPGEELSVSGFVRYATGTEKAGTSAHVSANTGIPEWYTPPEYIAAIKLVLGIIDLDPASSLVAQETIQARRFFTLEDDGLAHSWRGRVFLNPPYAADLVMAFVNKLCDHYEEETVLEAILLVNNATETKWLQRALALAAAACFPAGRLKFLDEDGNHGAPLQGQVFLYFGTAPWNFCQFFNEFGTILYGGKGVLWQFEQP